MTITGSNRGLLDGLHASGCSGKEYSTCRPVATEDPTLTVVLMVWCGDCGAAEWDVV
jgi:hypothetical protein